MQIPEALSEGENDADAELVNLTSANESPIALATFKNCHMQAVWEFRNGTAGEVVRYKGEMSGGSGTLRSMDTCVSHDGTHIIISESNAKNDADNSLRIYRTGKDGSATLPVDGEAVRNLTISHRNRFVAGASKTNIFVWDLQQSRLILTITGHRAPVSDIDFSRDERSLATLSADGMLMVWGLPLPPDEQISTHGLGPLVREQHATGR